MISISTIPLAAAQRSFYSKRGWVGWGRQEEASAIWTALTEPPFWARHSARFCTDRGGPKHVWLLPSGTCCLTEEIKLNKYNPKYIQKYTFKWILVKKRMREEQEQTLRDTPRNGHLGSKNILQVLIITTMAMVLQYSNVSH